MSLYYHFDFTKTQIQRSRERNIIFSSNKKIYISHINGYVMAKNSFVAEVNFKLKATTYINILNIVP